MKTNLHKLALNVTRSVVVVGTLLTAGAVHAQVVQGSDTFQVTANVLGACSVSAADLNFGSYQSGTGSASVTGSTTVTVTCPNTQPYEVGLDQGVNASATTTRAMAGGIPAGGSNLDYELFTDSGLTTVWGDTFGVDTKRPLIGTGAPQAHQVFGQIPGGQTVNPGPFADTITAVVFF